METKVWEFILRIVEVGVLVIAAIIGTRLTVQLHKIIGQMRDVLREIPNIIRHIKMDAGLREMGNIHREFWTNTDCATVRAWIACDKAYEGEVQRTLAKRGKEIDENRVTAHDLTVDDYAILDQLDLFFNLLLRIKSIDSDFTVHKKEYDRLYLSYWIKAIKTRPELLKYAQKFYGDLIEDELPHIGSVEANAF